MRTEPWYASDRFEAGAYGLGAQHHGEKDPLGHAFWSGGQAAGVIDGAISNLGELGWDVPTVFERLRRAPERTLDALEGPFTIACVVADDERVALVARPELAVARSFPSRLRTRPRLSAGQVCVA